MAAKLKDIADRLGLSVGTISRALNGMGRVGDNTRASILKAAAELNYRPNDAARTLKKKSANIIGVIVPDISNNFFANVIKGIEDKAYGNSHMVIVCSSNADPVKEAEYVGMLIQKQIKGIIIASVGGNSPSLLRQNCGNTGITAVFIDNIPDNSNLFHIVTIDNAKAAYDITTHLINCGYSRIAAITGPVLQSTATERLDGFLKCLGDKGITIGGSLVGMGDFGKESGYNIMKSWLESGEKPDALFAANNFMAYGAINAILEKGLKIPDDIAVACFDAIDDTGLIRPRLTSVIQPAFDIGSVAAELIIDNKKRGYEAEQGRKIILAPEFYIGESTGKTAVVWNR